MARKKINISGVSEKYAKEVDSPIKAENQKNFLPLRNRKIGISVSDSEQFQQLGFSETHQRDITIELSRYLLVNGAHLIYGGDLREKGYTYSLSELSFQYRNKEENDQIRFTNYFGWPIFNLLKNSDEAEFKRNRVKIKKTGIPKSVAKDEKKVFIRPNTLQNQVLWAESMMIMREEMIKETNARIFLGGKLTDYRGFYPGIIQEGYFTMLEKQPMYLLGAFGGATNLIIRSIKGESEKKLVSEVFEYFPAIEELYIHIGRKQMTDELIKVFAGFRKLSIDGLCKLNGLSKSENELLFKTPHFHEMIYYILTGLKRTYTSK